MRKPFIICFLPIILTKILFARRFDTRDGGHKPKRHIIIVGFSPSIGQLTRDILITHNAKKNRQMLKQWLQVVLVGVFVVANGFMIRSSHQIPPPTRSQCRSKTTSTVLEMSTEIPSRQAISEGMELFRQGDVAGSINKFDSSVPQGSRAYLWQRGLSYYYADEFQKGSQQFRDDVLRSPLDVEEIVWDIACLLRMDPTFPPKTMMSLPPGKKDRRPIMVKEKNYPFTEISWECRII